MFPGLGGLIPQRPHLEHSIVKICHFSLAFLLSSAAPRDRELILQVWNVRFLGFFLYDNWGWGEDEEGW